MEVGQECTAKPPCIGPRDVWAERSPAESVSETVFWRSREIQWAVLPLSTFGHVTTGFVKWFCYREPEERRKLQGDSYQE